MTAAINLAIIKTVPLSAKRCTKYLTSSLTPSLSFCLSSLYTIMLCEICDNLNLRPLSRALIKNSFKIDVIISQFCKIILFFSFTTSKKYHKN